MYIESDSPINVGSNGGYGNGGLFGGDYIWAIILFAIVLTITCVNLLVSKDNIGM